MDSPIRPRQWRRRSVNGLKERRGRPKTCRGNQPNRADSAAAASLQNIANMLLLSTTVKLRRPQRQLHRGVIPNVMCSSFTVG